MSNFQLLLLEDSLFTASAGLQGVKTPKPVTHSVRLDRRVYEELSKEASKKSASFNNLVNQILKKHVEFDQFIPDLNFVLIHKGLIIGDMEGQNDDTVLSRAEAAGGAFARDTILTMGLPLNKESLLYFIDPVVCRYKNFADCQRYRRDGKEVFYLRHELGARWSLFLKGYVSGAFKNVLDKEIEIDETKDGITFTV